MAKKDISMTRVELTKLFDEGASRINNDPVTGQKILSHALTLMPMAGIGWYNLGLALHQQRKIKSAIRAYRKAIELTTPPLESALNNIAQDLLLTEEWNEGWEYYEHRLNKMKEKMSIYYQLYGEPWTGFHDTRRCDELIIVAEQGYGDTIQFCRLIKYLKKEKIKVSLFCQENLSELLKDSEIGKIRRILTSDANDGIRWCPLLSVPHRLGLNETNISREERYIRADDDFRKKWKMKLKSENKLLIGIHWQGNPDFEKRLYSAGRSIPVENFRALSRLENTEIIILQKGQHRKDYKKEFGLNIVQAQQEFDSTLDFRETAGAIANCDFVVSSDSSVAHLSSAMGIPTLILLCKIPEWRWGLEGSESRWYKSCKLYRQKEKNNWESVIQDVVKDLKSFIK